MTPSAENTIGVDSSRVARLERLIRAETALIERLSRELSVRYNESSKRRWLEARNRLRQLRLDLLKLDADCGWL